LAGFGTTARSSGTQSYSAKAPLLAPNTSSPGRNCVMSLPTASTVADSCADCCDLSGQLTAENRPLRSAETAEEPGDDRLGSAPLAVCPVDRRGVNLDQYFVVLGYRPLDVLESQNVRRPIPVVDNCSHAFTSSQRFDARDGSGRPSLAGAP